jgi:hypothetical protein
MQNADTSAQPGRPDRTSKNATNITCAFPSQVKAQCMAAPHVAAVLKTGVVKFGHAARVKGRTFRYGNGDETSAIGALTIFPSRHGPNLGTRARSGLLTGHKQAYRTTIFLTPFLLYPPQRIA